MVIQLVRAAIIFAAIFIAANCIAAPENLDELDTRKTRLEVNSWGKEYLEDPVTFVWQPETLAYADITTGAEVWRISSTDGRKTSIPDIGWPQWSADGKRFSYGSARDVSGVTSGYETHSNASYQGTVMMMQTDGTYLRPAINGPFVVYTHSRYLHWSPVEPDVYYGFGRNFAAEGLRMDDLYRVTVGDIAISKSLILDLDLAGAEVNIKKAFSGDGTVLVAHAGGKNYPILINNGTATLAAKSGWSRYRQLDNFWGNTPATTAYSFHDNYVIGTGANVKMYFLPEGLSSWWKSSLSGTGADGGPEHIADNVAPYAWGDVEPVLTGFGSGGKCGTSLRSPWNCDGDPATGPEQYLSHPGFDRWGKYVVGVNSQQYRGHGVFDLINHGWYNAHIPTASYAWGHDDWAAWSDYFSSSPSGYYLGIPENNFIYTHKIDGTDSKPLANAHIRESGTSDYNSLPRVTQSPDGTKLVYHSDFLYKKWTTKFNGWLEPPSTLWVSETVVGSDLKVNDHLSSGYISTSDVSISALGTGTGGAGSYQLAKAFSAEYRAFKNTTKGFNFGGWIQKGNSLLGVFPILHVVFTKPGSDLFSVGDILAGGGVRTGQSISAILTGSGGVGTYTLTGTQDGNVYPNMQAVNHQGGWDMFYTVGYYPHPPEITSVTGTGTYTIRFDWRTDQATSRGYTQRGWPTDAQDPPPPRETKAFKLWRSADGTSGWTPIATVDAEIFSRYNFATGIWSGSKSWTLTDTPGAGTFYYAVTAIEHSGLESRVLSNVFSSAGAQVSAYPANPKQDTGVTATYQPTSIRYFNVYARDGSLPVIQQQSRIASIPIGAPSTFLDWLGKTDGTTQYAVTAVDTQGNESAPVVSTSAYQATPGHYRVTWEGSVIAPDPKEPELPPPPPQNFRKLS